jgi:hypothetical protein
LEDNVALRLDGLAVDEDELIAPFVQDFGDGGNEIRRARPESIRDRYIPRSFWRTRDTFGQRASSRQAMELIPW